MGTEAEASDGQVPPPVLIPFPSSHFPNYLCDLYSNPSRRWFSSDLGQSRPALSRQIRQLRRRSITEL
jgi:hypothetical protein